MRQQPVEKNDYRQKNPKNVTVKKHRWLQTTQIKPSATRNEAVGELLNKSGSLVSFVSHLGQKTGKLDARRMPEERVQKSPIRL